MSRPPGLPQRPPPNAYGQRGGDSYRPLPPPPTMNYDNQNRDSYNRNNDAYQSQGVSYRQNDENRAPGTYSVRGVAPPFPRGPADSYKPPSSDFTFRRDAPQTLDLSRTRDSYRPSDQRYTDRDSRQGPPPSRSRRPGQNRSGQAQGRGGYRGRTPYSRKAAERPFLQTNRAPTPELMQGMEETVEHAPKYKALEDLSDSDEAEMDLSEDEDNLGQEEEIQPVKKQARTETKAADGDSVPRWSNPDPYTALPPPDESQQRKKDVVKLIRKARVTSSLNELSKPAAETDDFISFDFGDDDAAGTENSDKASVTADDDADEGDISAMATASFSHRDSIVGPRETTKPLEHATPVMKQRQIDTSTDPDLGNRKRTHDDNIKGPSLIPKPTPRNPAGGNIVPSWKAKSGVDSTPWLVDHSITANMGAWLHKEVMDFFYSFKPTAVEEDMRGALIADLRRSIQTIWPDADVLPFGSYPAGLYLPTADMDLVFVSNHYMNGGFAKYGSKNSLWKFRDFLERQGIAAPNSVEVISRAKVPLVKYIDHYTGLRVDVSFENDTGLIANKTFQDWKAQFPAMPILVTVIKQFLAMRGLNEPVNGGIGGFTVTCLVVSLLQLMPQVQSGSMIPEHHLGEMLMEFFDLYGNEFNVVTTAIQLKPPGYISKGKSGMIPYRSGQQDKFSIIDPNNESNDIAGGSHNTFSVRKAFSQAYDDLSKCMSELNQMPIAERRNQSILGVVLGGNYSSFDIQRNHLERIWHREQDRRY